MRTPRLHLQKWWINSAQTFDAVTRQKMKNVHLLPSPLLHKVRKNLFIEARSVVEGIHEFIIILAISKANPGMWSTRATIHRFIEGRHFPFTLAEQRGILDSMDNTDVITIREVRRSDMLEWLRLRTMLWTEYPLAMHQQEMQGVYDGGDEEYLVLVADAGVGKLAGFIEASVREN